MAKKKSNSGPFMNQSAKYPHEISSYETIAETAKRRERSAQLGWPGSISLSGRLLGKPNAIPEVVEEKTEE